MPNLNPGGMLQYPLVRSHDGRNPISPRPRMGKAYPLVPTPFVLPDLLPNLGSKVGQTPQLGRASN